MAHESTITKTEVQGISAQVLLLNFQRLETQLTDLQKSIEPKPETELLTRHQVAERLGVSLPTLHAWTKKGILKAYRIGNKVRYKKNEVYEALRDIHSQTSER